MQEENIKTELINRIIRIVFASVICLASYYAGKSFRMIYFYTTMFLSPICVIYIIFQVLKILYLIQFVKRIVQRVLRFCFPILSRMKKVWAGMTNTLFRIAKKSVVYQKFEYIHLKDKSRITGYSDEFMRTDRNKENFDYEKSRLKWKKCNTNAERVRFLYARYVMNSRKQGKVFKYADTPSQLQKRWGKDKYNELLFEQYYEARYDCNNEINNRISDELIEQLKSKKNMC